jgi:Secretion system C-terminal sorting domain
MFNFDMKKLPILLVLLVASASILRGQTTPIFTKVYSILQTKCVQCHSNAAKSGGLDLEGSGTDKPTEVFNNLVGVAPTNAAAATKGYKRVYAGRPDRSFLFHKINGTFDTYYPSLGTGEGAAMPKSGTALTSVEKEFIRQWMLFGANKTAVVPEGRIRAFYDTVGRALSAFATPPAAPAAGQGFQIRMGPFFLGPQGQAGNEAEYFQKYEVNLPTAVEVNRIDHKIANSSHHFITYSYNTPAAADVVEAGLRLNAYHNNINLVAAVQEATDLKLPTRTAFKWAKDRTIDLNSHYINYSSMHVYKAEAFLNFYTQPNGTAKQEMKADLVANGFIYIPNNNQTTTFEQATKIGTAGKGFIWAMTGHTHKYGTGYKIWQRKTDGTKGTLLYDAGCPAGVPDCQTPTYDYQHIPMRYYAPFVPFNSNPAVIHQATWKNNGPNPVLFGATSDDEMMVMIAMYVTDTTGLSGVTAVNDFKEIEGVQVAPNPMNDRTTFLLPASVSSVKFTLFDVLGRIVQQKAGITTRQFDVFRKDLRSGLYLYRLEDEQGRIKLGKVVME